MSLFNRRTELTPMTHRSALVERLEGRALMSGSLSMGAASFVPAVQLPAVQSTTTTLLPAVQKITDGTSNTIMFG
jgi:hypothetical protein